MLNYKGLKGVYERLIVSEAQVDRQVDALLEQHVRVIPVTDRPSRLDDELVLDYAGFCDGVQFEGGTAQNQTLVLGSGTFIPGFEDQLVGKRPGITCWCTSPSPPPITPRRWRARRPCSSAAEGHPPAGEVRAGRRLCKGDRRL